MQITGTFLDEISHDIPHQNWGRAEWDRDLASMKSVGIDTVILIRCRPPPASSPIRPRT